jgi:phage-related minor tail protein
MVDNIKLNKILPLLSSTERVKQVDRRQRNSQKSPFNDTLKKKKKKKKDGENVEISEAALTEDSVQAPSHTGNKRSAKDKKPRDDPPSKIIDIRV